MKVELVPVVYVRQPDYWEIELVGCLRGGICLPVVMPFAEAIPIQGTTGTKGIKVVGATKVVKLDVPPKPAAKPAAGTDGH
jgi:hypothetical protein